MMIVIARTTGSFFGKREQTADGGERRGAVPRAGLQRDRVPRRDRAQRRAAGLDLPPLPRRQGRAGHRDGPLRGVLHRGADRAARAAMAIRRRCCARSWVGGETAPGGSDFRAGCPVVAVAVEAHDDDALVAATGEAFAGWERSAGRRRCADPARRRRGRGGSQHFAIAAIEGAVVMCRAQRSTQPLLDVGRELEQTIEAAQSG